MFLDLTESKLKGKANMYILVLKGKEQIIAGIEEIRVVLFLSLHSVSEIGCQSKCGVVAGI